MSSGIDLIGSDALTARTLGWLEVMITAARSFCGSYGSLAYRCGPNASGPLNEITIVYPSGGDLATRSVATVPPAAGRLSTMTGCPSRSFNLSPIRRASTSSELPAGAATMNLIGLSGQACAPASCGAANAAASSTYERRILRKDMGFPWLFRRVTDRFDVVPVGIQHKRAIVVRMVLRPEPRTAVVLTAGRHRRAVEGLDLRVRFGAERHVYRRNVRLVLADPEVGLGRDAEAGELLPFHDQRVAERCQRRAIKRLALFHVGNRNAGVIDHFIFQKENITCLPGRIRDTRAAPFARASGSRPRPTPRFAGRR